MIPGMFAAGAVRADGPAPGGDPHWSDVVLLTDMRAPDGTTFVDAKGHPLTANGTVEISGGEAVFNGSSNDFISSPDSDDWAFGSEFCIELFGVRVVSPRTRHHTLIAHYDAFSPLTTHRSWFLSLETDGRIRFLLSPNGISTSQQYYSAAIPPGPGTYDIRFERWDDAGTLRGSCYLDGARLGSEHDIPNMPYNAAGPFAIGTDNAGSSGAGRNPFIGGMQAARLTRAARNPGAASYPVPTLPLPTS